MNDSAIYTDNRRGGWGYDADGRNTTIGTRSYTFDADGQMRSMSGQQWVINHYVNVTQTMGYDGDGEKVKETASGQTTYYLRASVLGGAIIEEINSSGQKTVGYVYAGSQMLARQSVAGSGSYITWKRSSPAGTGQYDYNVGSVFGSGSPSRIELDPLGAKVPLEYTPPPETQNQGDVGEIGGIMDSRWSNFFDLPSGCTANNGAAASCSGSMAQKNLDGAMRAFFGDSWYDLPGNNNEVGRAEAIYVRMVELTIAAYRAAQAAKKKPKPPKLKPQPKKRPSKKEIEKRKEQNGKVGKLEIEEHGLTVYLAQPDQRGGSYLNPCAMHVFEELGFGRYVNLNEVRVHIGIPETLDKLAAITAGAMTVGNDIYYKSVSDYNPTNVEGLAEVGHELTHVMQQRIMGLGPFTTQYVGEYLANRAKGMSPKDAYEKISFEVAAYKVEELLGKRIRQQYGNDPCKQFRY